MVTKDAMIKGLIDYIDVEVMPHLPAKSKWGMGTMVILAKDNAEHILDHLLDTDLARDMMVVDDSHNIDIERLASAMRESVEKYGDICLEIPIIGRMKFDSNDVEKAKTYIMRY